MSSKRRHLNTLQVIPNLYLPIIQPTSQQVPVLIHRNAIHRRTTHEVGIHTELHILHNGIFETTILQIRRSQVNIRQIRAAQICVVEKRLVQIRFRNSDAAPLLFGQIDLSGVQDCNGVRSSILYFGNDVFDILTIVKRFSLNF